MATTSLLSLFDALQTVSGQGVAVPILLGAARPVHIRTPASTVRRIVKMTALDAIRQRQGRS